MFFLGGKQDRGTPLHYACLRGHLEVAQVLLSKGAYQDKQDMDGNFPHHWAAGNSKTDVLEFLLANPEARSLLKKTNKSGDTVLHAAARGETANSIHLLVKAGSSTGALNKKGDTALHIAARNGKENCVRALLEYTKEVTKNEEDKLPQELAVNSVIKAMIEDHLKSPNPPMGPEAEAGNVKEETVEVKGEEVKEEQVSGLAERSGAGNGNVTAGGAASPKPKKALTKAEKSEAMAHMSTNAREKLKQKSGHQKFLEKYNLASNRDPMLSNLLKAEE